MYVKRVNHLWLTARVSTVRAESIDNVDSDCAVAVAVISW